MATYRALLVGNSTFPEDPHNLPELHGPVNDLPLLHEALTDTHLGLFEPEHVRILPERTKREITTALEELMLRAGMQDVVLLYYSGHGKQDEYDNLYLCARDSRSNLLRSTAISNGDITAMMERSSARTFVVILDCCYSGAFKGGSVPTSLGGSGRFVITSSRHAQLSADAPKVSGPSAFTKCLVEGLRLGALDANGDGFVSLSDVYEYVLEALRGTTGQIPQRHFDRAVGDVILARVRGQEAPVPNPPAPVRSEPPLLDVSETSIELRDVQLGEVLEPQTVDVFNRGGGELNWTAESDVSWIHIEKLETGVRLRFDALPGINRGSVYIRDNGGGGSRTVRVLVHVLSHRQQLQHPQPRLSISKTSIDFGLVNVGTEVQPKSVKLVNLGGGTLNARAWANQPWLHVRQAAETLDVSIDTRWIGALAGEIHISSDGGEGRIPVTASVGPGPVLSVPAKVDFGKVPPGSRSAMVVPVKNVGTGQLTWQVGHSADFFTVRATERGVEVRLTAARVPSLLRGSFWLRSNGGYAVVEVTAAVTERPQRQFLVRHIPQVVAVAAILALAGILAAFIVARREPAHVTSRPPAGVGAPGPGAPGPIAAVSRQPQLIDAFWVDGKGAVTTGYFNPGLSGNGWRVVALPGESADGDPLSAVAVLAPIDANGNQLDVFWRRSNGAIAADEYTEDRHWSTLSDVAPAGATRPDSPIAAVDRGASRYTVLWVDTQGAVRARRVGDTGPGKLGDLAIVPGSKVAGASSLTVLAPPGRPLTAFWVRPDHAVMTASSDDGGQTWTAPRPIAGPGSADPGAGLGAVWLRNGDLFEVLWTHGSQIRITKGNAGNWPVSRVLDSSGPARMGSVLALVADNDQVQAFWIAPDGSIRTNDSTQPVAGGSDQRAAPRSGLVAFDHNGQVDVLWVTTTGAVHGNVHDANGPLVEIGRPGSVQTAAASGQ